MVKILFDKISQDLQKALKEKDTLRLETLRMMKSQITYVNPKGDLPDAEMIKILSKYTKKLKETIEEAKKGNRMEVAEKTEKELKIVEEYLPKKLSEEELKELIKKTIAEVGATTMKDIGKVMKTVMGEHPELDGKTVKDKVTELLKGPQPEGSPA